jgi:hypothetical protein
MCLHLPVGVGGNSPAFGPQTGLRPSPGTMCRPDVPAIVPGFVPIVPPGSTAPARRTKAAHSTGAKPGEGQDGMVPGPLVDDTPGALWEVCGWIEYRGENPFCAVDANQAPAGSGSFASCS